MFERHAKARVHELLNEFRVVYIAGPRQSGKTTLAKAVATERGMAYFSLDEPSVLASARSDPYGFIEALGSQNIVIDEFQYVPELVSVVKLVSDQLPAGQRGRFLLTGSADLFSSAKIQESLPGHMARLELYPLSLAERSARSFNLIDFLVDSHTFIDLTASKNLASKAKQTLSANKPKTGAMSRQQLSEWILRGGYPELEGKTQRSQSAWYRSYVQGRLFKDFESLYAARGEYHDKLKALIPYLAGLNAQLLKYASVANDLAQNDKVVKSYIEALEWMYIVKRIPPFITNSAKRETLGMPKLHMIDTGLACHLLGIHTVEQLMASTWYGAMIENLVLTECLKHLAWSEQDATLMHFRDKKKNEVDIVLETGNNALIGIEVKGSATVTERDFVGLSVLADFVGPKFKRGLVFYTGERVLPFKRGDHQFHAVPLSWLS
jgi:uncharacterized protein